MLNDSSLATAHTRKKELTFRLPTIDWASKTEGWRLSYSDRRGSKESMKVDLSCWAAWTVT